LLAWWQSWIQCALELLKLDATRSDGIMIASRIVFTNFYQAPAAQRIGVQRPATALTGPDPSDLVCRQAATKVN
jgi:hypothetical protein